MSTKKRPNGALSKREGASPPVSYNALAALATPDGSRRAATNRAAAAAAKSRPLNDHFVEANKMVRQTFAQCFTCAGGNAEPRR
jgi:hypothetical protein